MRSSKATPPQIPLLGVLVDENKKEDKHVEAFIEIFKDPASMPAPPPVGNCTQSRRVQLSLAISIG